MSRDHARLSVAFPIGSCSLTRDRAKLPKHRAEISLRGRRVEVEPISAAFGKPAGFTSALQVTSGRLPRGGISLCASYPANLAARRRPRSVGTVRGLDRNASRQARPRSVPRLGSAHSSTQPRRLHARDTARARHRGGIRARQREDRRARARASEGMRARVRFGLASSLGSGRASGRVRTTEGVRAACLRCPDRARQTRRDARSRARRLCSLACTRVCPRWCTQGLRSQEKTRPRRAPSDRRRARKESSGGGRFVFKWGGCRPRWRFSRGGTKRSWCWWWFERRGNASLFASSERNPAFGGRIFRKGWGHEIQR